MHIHVRSNVHPKLSGSPCCRSEHCFSSFFFRARSHDSGCSGIRARPSSASVVPEQAFSSDSVVPEQGFSSVSGVPEKPSERFSRPGAAVRAFRSSRSNRPSLSGVPEQGFLSVWVVPGVGKRQGSEVRGGNSLVYIYIYIYIYISGTGH